MTIYTVAGPFATKAEAEETARVLGNQYSAFGKHRVDEEGYTLDECDWFVEQDTSIVSNRIFGYGAAEFMAKQYR
jgi:hypothetical protein